MRRRRMLRIIIPTAAIGVLALFAAVGALSRNGGLDLDALTGLQSESETVSAANQTMARTGALVQSTDSTDTGTESTGKSAGETGDVAATVPQASMPSAHHLVRTGDVSLLVARHALSSSADRVRSITAALGGYVMSSTLGSDDWSVEPQSSVLDTSKTPDGAAQAPAETDTSSATTNGDDPYATFTVRVPGRSFDLAVERFSTLGTVRSLSTTSEDVTSQYVDLRARLQHFRAVERRLIGFLAETHTVDQMLKVQDRIDDVQLTIEELTAQVKSMRETTAYGTVSILLRERRLPQTGSLDATDTFWGTFVHSLKLVAHGARVTALALTAVLPFAVVFGAIAGVVWYVLRRQRRSRRRTSTPTLPA